MKLNPVICWKKSWLIYEIGFYQDSLSIKEDMLTLGNRNNDRQTPMARFFSAKEALVLGFVSIFGIYPAGMRARNIKLTPAPTQEEVLKSVWNDVGSHIADAMGRFEVGHKPVSKG